MTATTNTAEMPATSRKHGARSRSDIADDICCHVGARLRAARNIAGISQEDAGKIVGVSFQQMQKYEKGVNRITVGNLVLFSTAFGLPIAWFFEDAPGMAADGAPIAPGGEIITEMLTVPYGLDLAKDFLAIDHNLDRSVVAQVARGLAKKGRPA